MGQAAVTDAARKDEAALEDYRSGRDFGQQTELAKLEFGYSEKLLEIEAQNALDLLKEKEIKSV